VTVAACHDAVAVLTRRYAVDRGDPMQGKVPQSWDRPVFPVAVGRQPETALPYSTYYNTDMNGGLCV